MAYRAFRTDESLQAELVTRSMIPDIFGSRGFRSIRDDSKVIGTSISQTVHATGPDGRPVSVRVKLGWRSRERKIKNSASQLIAKIRTTDWEGEIQSFIDRARHEGITHFLFVEREEGKICGAALVPAKELLGIWCAQRDLSDKLIRAGQFGRRRKNPTMNGSSPTLWLAEISAPAVADVLWKHPQVQNLLDPIDAIHVDDTYADLGGIDYALIGSDGAARIEIKKSLVKRDPRVRAVVLARAEGKCERCAESRLYVGFLDVHHVLGAEKSDRVWNCVAICPNCHREAHFAPEHEQINRILLGYAMRFQSSDSSTGRRL